MEVRIDVDTQEDIGIACLDASDLLDGPGDSVRLKFYMRRHYLGHADITAGAVGEYVVTLALYTGDGEPVIVDFEHDGYNPLEFADEDRTTAAQFYQSGARFQRPSAGSNY